jgi:hypothetical protein
MMVDDLFCNHDGLIIYVYVEIVERHGLLRESQKREV